MKDQRIYDAKYNSTKHLTSKITSSIEKMLFLKALSNFLYTFKENLVGKSKMTIGQLAEFCTENSELPGEELPNEPFVLDHIIFDKTDPSTLIDYEDGDQFRLVNTTRNFH